MANKQHHNISNIDIRSLGLYSMPIRDFLQLQSNLTSTFLQEKLALAIAALKRRGVSDDQIAKELHFTSGDAARQTFEKYGRKGDA